MPHLNSPNTAELWKQCEALWRKHFDVSSAVFTVFYLHANIMSIIVCRRIRGREGGKVTAHLGLIYIRTCVLEIKIHHDMHIYTDNKSPASSFVNHPSLCRERL